MDAIQVVRDGQAWAVKHKGSYLGFVKTHGEATRIACELAAQMLEEVDKTGAAAAVATAQPIRPR